jgi:hypothetical protein
MKKFLMVLGGIFVAILVIFGIAAAIFIPRLLQLDREATAYIQDAVPKIVENWNSKELLDRATPELLSVVKSNDEIDRLFTMFQQLGSLKRLETPRGSVVSRAFTGAGTSTVGNYTAQADFEKGTATIHIQLRRVNDAWLINGFRINSDVFLPPKTSPSGATYRWPLRNYSKALDQVPATFFSPRYQIIKS